MKTRTAIGSIEFFHAYGFYAETFATSSIAVLPSKANPGRMPIKFSYGTWDHGDGKSLAITRDLF